MLKAKVSIFMKGFFRFILIIVCLLGSSFAAHKYYTSITKIEIDETAQLFKIHTQLFVDDFEKVMHERYGVSSLIFSSLSEKEKQLMATYITKKLSLKVNRSPVELSYLGCELEGELLYVYLEGKCLESVKRLDVENTLLQDVFSEQQNKIDINYKNKVKSLYLHTEAPRGAVFF